MTDRAGIDHVLDAIDNALWDWAESPDAMTVRYDANGDGGPGTLAESPDRTLVGGDARLPSSVLEATNVYISARGIEWVNTDGEVVHSLLVVEDPDLLPDLIRVEPQPPEPPLPLLRGRVPRRPIPDWRIDWGDIRPPTPPPVPQINVEGIREALRNIQPPRFPYSRPPVLIDEAVRFLAADLQPVGREFTTRINALGQAVIKVRETFRLMARTTRLGPWPELEAPRDQAARERALEARRTRNTGPSRNPHRHRGI